MSALCLCPNADLLPHAISFCAKIIVISVCSLVIKVKMYRNKKDVDKHVENLISKLSVKEFKTRAYSVARLYYEVGDYASCQRYVEQYLTQKDNNAAAYKLLGQALHKLGQKEKALEQYKTSLDIDPTQTSTILDICELLVDDEINIDLGRAKYWCEKAEATFPRHPITFRLREKLVSVSNPNPEALVNLLTAELAISPKDPLLHARLLKHYIHTNQIKEAVNHSCNVEFGEKTFRYNYAWYETLAELLKHNSHNYNDWLFQLLLLTVRERMCILSLTDMPSSSKSLNEANELIFLYDQDIEKVSKAGVTPGFGEFHASLLQHHRGQFVFHAATLLLKKAKKDQLSWSLATQCAGPLMLMAWHIAPNNIKANWLSNAPEKQKQAAHRWYYEGAYRCSQAGHYLISNSRDKNQSYVDQISQCCSGTHWRDKMYEKLFTSRPHLAKIKSSHFVASGTYNAPILRLPRKTEVEAFDAEAQMEYPNSLHHFVWILLHYKNFAQFKCSIFDALTPSATNTGPESMNKIDIQAFLYCSALTSKQQKPNNLHYVSSDKPIILPANITDLLCTLSQLKWWDCAYKFSQNELGTELTDIRGTLSRGIEVVRCIDSHGLDPELLCQLGRIFSEKSKLASEIEERNNLEQRAGLYYSSAIPLLEKLKSRIVIKLPEKRMFDYTHKEFNSKDLNSLIEESKLFVAMTYVSECEYDKAIGLLSSLKSPEAQYHLSQTYRKLALDENNQGDKYVSLLLKAKTMAYKTLDGWQNSERHKNNPLFSDTQELIDELDSLMNKIDPDLTGLVANDVDGKYYSNENVSLLGCDHTAMQSKFPMFRNLSSTPKAPVNSNNITNYRTAVDNQLLESTQVDQRYLERIETEIKNLQKRDTTINNFMEETKKWFEENRKLGNEIITTIHSNIQNTTDQFKLLKISVDQVKDQIDECRNECKDVGELKKQIAEMKKEINKLKKTSSEHNIDESDLYNLEDDYRTSESTSTFTPQLPFVPPVMPPFNQRLVPPFPVPPNPYHLYGQNLYNLYSQYSQFGQSSQVPGAPPIFDPNRGQVNYPGVYPTPEAMYLDVAQLVQPPIPATPAVSLPTAQVASSLSAGPSIPTIPTVSMPAPATTVSITKPISKIESKDIPRSLPVNVVITSSDPLPTCTTIPTPILSVTIPSKHIKGSPHNYQIPMPVTTDTKVISPPVFSFPSADNKLPLNKTGNTSNNSWSQVSVFKTAVTASTAPVSDVTTDSLFNNSRSDDLFEISKSVVDGVLNTSNVSHNKSRTLSEKSNTSVEYDPCPDFQPIIPLPAEVTVTTGEEDETIIFSSRAKLFRFVDKQWKERGLGEIKLLKHKVTGKVRVLMRREQIHKICANHIITSNMEIKPMKNETKAYFWVANDFADETVILEKFCVRFKTADIATQFYEKFEEARKESPSSNVSSDKVHQDKKLPEKQITPVKNNSDTFSVLQSSKPGFTVGGFTFSSTPSFKPVVEDDKAESKPAESSANKANIFSSFSFKSNTSSSFGNIFTAPVSQSVNASIAPEEKEASSKLNTSDTVEEFEPNVQFEPVVPLPALIDQKTGEEDETILFEHRAKLLRFDSTAKEWKERGLGNIKLLVHKDNVQKVRLIMRREQIMKVCCNHALSKEMTFQKMPNMDKAVTWCAKDFSDGELISETFCLRFKTVQICDDFIEAVKAAQSKMKDDTKAAKEEQNAAKQNTQIGFGDQFKPKPGAWNCSMCYTNNLESFNKCACCEQPKPQTIPISGTTATLTNISTIVPPKTATVLTPTNWGDAFKPKPGTWECKECLIRNEATAENCSACNSAKDPSVIKSGKVASGDGFKFKFGMPASNPEPSKDTSISGKVGWGDKFKPKEGSWECQQCLVRNEADSKNCSACSSPKNPSAVSTESNSIFGIGSSGNSGPKFSFGIPANSAKTITSQSSNQTSSIFDGTGAHKFSFGIPSATENNSTNIVTFGEQQSQSRNVIIATPKAPDNQGPLNFSLKINDQGDINVTPKVEAQKNGSNQTQFGGTFDFVFKPKTPPKGKSPLKSPKTQKGEESDDNEYASEDEGHHIHFSPVIPLPDKVEVVTGEENENELYGHRAKLFRFVSGEWKERGIGVVKILKHKDTGNLRVVMRREQVLKICLNHALTSEITYTPKDDKTWLFAANDFSEGELSLQQFCLRFKSKEIATEFKQAIENARGNKKQETINKGANNKKQDSDPEEVVFINEIQASAEEKQKAKELMLPENFFTYKVKEPCQGCRGCDLDDIKTSRKAVVSSGVSTPVKTSIPLFSSPANSFYGTPTNFDKTTDVSLFRTPLGSLGSNTNTSSPLSTNSTLTKNDDTTNKENSFAQKPNLFSSLLEQKTIFGTPPNNPNDKTNITDTQTPTSTKTSGILAPPKLSTMTKTGDEKQNVDPKSIFAAAQNNSVFGKSNSLFGNFNSGTENKSVFGFTAANTTDDSEKQDVKSVFGGDIQKPVGLFSGNSSGSLFGPEALSNSQTKPVGSIFGTGAISTAASNTSPSQVFGNRRSIFGNNQAPTWTSNAIINDQKKPDVTPQESTIKKTEEPKLDSEDKKDTPFKVDNSLSFAALSSSGPGFNLQKKADFQWEGAGQQLFSAAQKEAANAQKNESGAGDDTVTGADEEYDPHYEPIVPLPDKIVVTTGEEDEEKMFGERCKLYRYDEKSREWKERGVGEMKVLYHPERKTYRLLLRREQVHKAVLNMLIFMDLELLPMKNSDRAWTWAGRNYAETAAGEQETLAVRFKSVDLATGFRDKIVECVRKLQATAAQAIREEKESNETPFTTVTPLRLPKHLQDSARADKAMSAKAEEHTQSPPVQHQPFFNVKTEIKPNGQVNKPTEVIEVSRQVHFEEPTEEEEQEEDGYEHDYNEDYDGYYNEEDEESAPYYTCEGSAFIQHGTSSSTCENAHVQVLFDQEMYSPKILVTDADTGEILADMLIHTDTEFQVCFKYC
ncbi:unnamed protein product [Diatraea saccharalis]|uniref:E3 SUMO-protein ligase RanBP2 n=1 Tax=Diatraea saccharalis TaxID=40085 RepID=A0A9N9QQ19_9NEOP|nr:unnamed protein product [Diatraea saccharalis]